MATPTGWLKIYRKMLDDPNYLRKPFDKTHAWLDILLTVNFEKRVLVSLQWVWRYITRQRGARLIDETAFPGRSDINPR